MLPPDRSGVIPPLGRVGVIGAGGESGGAARYSVGMEIRSMTAAAARAASSPVAAA
jgi:molybdopterin/thiamine biosynthesis adenylyltransferase